MTYTVVPDKAAGDPFTEAMWDTYIRDNLNAGVVRPVGDTEVTVAAASIAFTSIAADWRHLLLVVYARGDTAAITTQLQARLNADSAANYDHQAGNFGAAAATAAETFAATSMQFGTMPAGTAGADLFSGHVVVLPHYASARNKMAVGFAGRKSGTATGNMSWHAYAGFWRSNAAITQVTLLPGAGNFDVGTVATLYGMGSI